MKPNATGRMTAFGKNASNLPGLVRRRFSRLALPLALLYALLFVGMTWHPHEQNGVGTGGTVSSYACAPVGTSQQTEVQSSHGVRTGCPVCDFLIQPVQQAGVPERASEPLLVFFDAPVAERPLPYLPYRFCDRSVSRGPPVS
ncbi:MAG: hypothetical protein SFU56_03315 [Capsulimonadales bacterium]|nr:hypothetical protein [Capsulimonadales bacterium]